MATREHDLGGYKPIAYSNEVDLGWSDNKYPANIRQTPGFSEQFMVDDKRREKNASQSGLFDRYMERINNLWVWELAAVIVALSALAVVVWLLIYLDGTKLQVWKLQIKPNAVLAIFMTIAKSCMLVAIGAGIAQLKWLHYGSAPRHLDELDLFDNAGRGPWGAFRFLNTLSSGRGGAKIVASVGALLVLLALAMDPFAQQLLSYEVRFNPQPALSSQTWVPATYAHDAGISVFNSGTLRKAIYGGFLGFEPPIDHSCGSSNCTWDPFVSLGVSSRCEDVAATVNKSCSPGAGVLNKNCTQLVYNIPSYNLSITLQNGSAIGITNQQNGSVIRTPNQQRYTLTKGVTSPLYPFTRQSPIQFHFAVAQLLINIDGTANVVDINALRNPSWNVTACTIQWSAKVYNGVRLSNSTFYEAPPEAIDLVHSQDSQCTTNATGGCQTFEAADKSRLPKDAANTTFHVASGDSKFTIRNLLIFDYNITSQSNSSALNALEADNVAATLFWNINITEASSHVAATSTNFLRSSANTFRVYGTAWADETYVEVRWVWFGLPAALVLLSATFLIVVIIMSRSRGDESEPLWKTSTLPLLLHGVGWLNRGGHHGTESSIAGDSTSRRMKAHLKRNHRGEIVIIKAS